MKVIRDDAWRTFLDVDVTDSGDGVRIKDVRERALQPGGRARLTLFASEGGGRPHPRLQVSVPPVPDPAPAAVPDLGAPTSAAELRSAITDAQRKLSDHLTAADLDPDAAPRGSARYWRNNTRTQRIAGFFAHCRNVAASLPGGERTEAAYAVAELEALAYAGTVHFDDHDTGTYHSFGHDAPFVHYLQDVLDALPAPGSEAEAVLPAEQAEAVRRQRGQAQRHLDYLMRHKYAFHGVTETDIERSVGGFLVERTTRRRVSEVPDPNTLVPRYELLRIAPDSPAPHAGAWVYRDGETLRLADGTEIPGNPPPKLRSRTVAPADLTFERAPDDPMLRPGVRFDWDGSGYVQATPLSWVSWAGHCDIKAVQECLGLTLTDPRPTVTEFRSDTATTSTFSRDRLLEMLTSVLELGSVYRRLDGSGTVVRGVHHFGGARNDSLPDRLQIQGLGQGRHFRWPLARNHDAFTVTSLAFGADDIEPSVAFARHVTDVASGTFADNPRFLETVEGDYNLIDVTGALVGADIRVDTVDPVTGYLRHDRQHTLVDLREAPEHPRSFLGTHVHDAGAREIFRVYLDRDRSAIVGELDRFEQVDGRWAPVAQPDEAVVITTATPLSATASREVKGDDPAAFQALLGAALRRGESIVADTDMEAPVWNGVVTRIEATRVAARAEVRTEHWRVRLKARYGDAQLEYLVRRSPTGQPVAYAPIPGGRAPDFLWQDFPDVGSKGLEGSDWVVNDAMAARNVVDLAHDPSVDGQVYVHDDHVKNVYEVLFAGLGGFPYTVVHNNKRYGFTTEAAWQRAVARLLRLRAQVRFEAPPATTVS